MSSSIVNGFRHSGHGGAPELLFPCSGAAWYHVTMQRVHARCIHRAMHGCTAGCTQMQHVGALPAITSLRRSKPLCCTVAWSSDVTSAPASPAARNARR
jgi:hypothetical protein